MTLPDYLKKQALNPEWEKRSSVHDWRNHVRENTRKIWETFTEAQKFAITEDAEECAHNEQWD